MSTANLDPSIVAMLAQADQNNQGDQGQQVPLSEDPTAEARGGGGGGRARTDTVWHPKSPATSGMANRHDLVQAAVNNEMPNTGETQTGPEVAQQAAGVDEDQNQLIPVAWRSPLADRKRRLRRRLHLRPMQKRLNSEISPQERGTWK